MCIALSYLRYDVLYKGSLKHEPYLPLSQIPSISTLWLVLIPTTHKGMARLSDLGGWLDYK